MRIVERLAAQGVTVGVNVAPVIPGLNDSEIATILEHAKAAGASHAGMVLLRLPGAVKQVFEDRVRAALPLRAERILRRVRETRGGKMYDTRFGTRQTGEGPYADMIGTLFAQTATRLGLIGSEMVSAPPESTFERPPRPGQLRLF